MSHDSINPFWEVAGVVAGALVWVRVLIYWWSYR